jgi:hypothetical protein
MSTTELRLTSARIGLLGDGPRSVRLSRLLRLAITLLGLMPACGGAGPTAPTTLPFPVIDLTPPTLDLSQGSYRLAVTGPAFFGNVPGVACTPPELPPDNSFREIRVDVSLERRGSEWVARADGDLLELVLRDEGLTTTTPPTRAVSGVLRGRAADPGGRWVLTLADVATVDGQTSGGRFGQPTRVSAKATGAARFDDRQGRSYACTILGVDLWPR